MDLKNITLSFTTCKRPEKFRQTVTSLVENCLDLVLVDEVVIVDDNSGQDSLISMENTLNEILTPALSKTTQIKLYSREDNKGHFHSIKYIFDTINTKYLFFMEDDWVFIKKDRFISNSLAILKYRDIDYIGLRNFICEPKLLNSSFAKKDSILGIDYYDLNLFASPTWPGYSFNPNIQKFQRIKENYITILNQSIDFERRLAFQSRMNGIRMGFLSPDCVKHIGEDMSAYVLNRTSR